MLGPVVEQERDTVLPALPRREVRTLAMGPEPVLPEVPGHGSRSFRISPNVRRTSRHTTISRSGIVALTTSWTSVSDHSPTLRHRPWNSGGRRSTYAVSASRRSLVPRLTFWASASVSSAWTSEHDPALSSWRLLIDSAIGGPAAMVAATSAVAASSDAAGTTVLTNPNSCARARVDHLGGERELLRPVHADALAQEPRRPEVEAQPALGVDRAEAGSIGAPDHVAREREAEARAHAHTVDLGDHGHRAAVHPDDGVAQHPHGVEMASFVRRASQSAREVGARAEVFAGAREHDHSCPRVADGAEHLAEDHPHLTGAHVLRRGSVDRDRGDMAVALDADIGMRRRRS